MSRMWIVDGRAFNGARWRSFVHDSLRDERVFFSDLNAQWNGDGTVSVLMKEKEDGQLERADDGFVVDERHPLYETNRGAAAGALLGVDEFDEYVLATFELPPEERLAKFDSLYSQGVRGDGDCLRDSWEMIPDTAKLIYTLHLWERFRKRKLHPAVWGAVLFMAWPHGKVSSMLFRAELDEREVVRMFTAAPPERLMTPEDLETFHNLPKHVTAYRGTSSFARYQEVGFSWTLSRRRAEWFAYANVARGQPVVLEAVIPRDAVLMYSDFEEELVVDPSHSRQNVIKHTLDGARRDRRMPALRRLLRYIEGRPKGNIKQPGATA